MVCRLATTFWPSTARQIKLIAGVISAAHNIRVKLIALILAVFLLSAASNTEGKHCGVARGEAVPNAATALNIAETVIAAHESRQIRAKFRLGVERDRSHGGWIASQSLPQPHDSDPKTIAVVMGGGGIGMRIDRCGAIRQKPPLPVR